MPRVIPDYLPGPPGATRFATQYEAWLRGLTPDQQIRFLERLDFLQQLTPFTGFRLQSRCAGLKSAVLNGTLNNPALGRSLLRSRSLRTRLRRGVPLTHHQRIILGWRAEEEARQRALGYDPDAYRDKG